MTPQRASRTAEFMALFRALESVRHPVSARLFDDRFARGFLRPSLRAVVDVSRVPVVGRAVAAYIDRRWPGARSSGIARTRLIDDLVEEALRDGIAQLVILGAGFDCRAYRIAGLERRGVFEVDHAATQAMKTARLRRMLGALPPHVVFVPLDFARQRLDQALDAAGFDPATRTLWLWEGVTNYLTEDAVDRTLRYVATSAAGSRLLFTYVHRGVLDGSTVFAGTDALVATLERAGEPWTFGIDPLRLGDFLAARGLALAADVGAADYRTRYLGDAMRGYEFYRAALAEVPSPEAARP